MLNSIVSGVHHFVWGIGKCSYIAEMSATSSCLAGVSRSTRLAIRNSVSSKIYTGELNMPRVECKTTVTVFLCDISFSIVWLTVTDYKHLSPGMHLCKRS